MSKRKPTLEKVYPIPLECKLHSETEENTMSDNADNKTKKSFIVSSYEHDGFDNFEAAKTEASKRAARDRDGDSYFVYELIGKVQTPTRVWNTTWEDVR
jgi:hypothetical protein